ncbi:competence type IV pilus ATPase ComGA [Enterococcus lemanii]|uniref:Competence type IV pilus ATPase ComGA n=1 Tax=Enterococcus lemanii TaxID=1159752 RepID=A0ABV9N035_9ENTE|nr:competence type IV pilus ATPase ComGA [Enterococcus lemanii]MBM7710404.1 competence protein ComGA [Enterococcus lemanii]NLM66077.1 Flp pilus assembly complex ATPase component TadA [Enterococcus sp.]
MSIERLSNELILYGVEQKMQDLYIYFLNESASVYYRKDQKMVPFENELSVETAQQLIARFKYLGEMDVGEKRKAQLGAISYPLENRQQRLRLSTVGDYRGKESLVIRFLHDLKNESVDYFFTEDARLIAQNILQKSGLYLFSGPTGSGKTTFMYHLAQKMKGQVITIEDPVEIEEPNFLQLQTNDKIQQTYDQLIKLSLRHRPDILIIGEIRDTLTAKAAIRAALTGHKVFATIHAKGVAETKNRLIDLVGESSELDNCLMGVIYQELFLDVKGNTKALLSYQFFEGERAHKSWEDAYAEIIRLGEIQ